MTNKPKPIEPTPSIQKLLRSQFCSPVSYYKKQEEDNRLIYLDKNENPFPPSMIPIDSAQIIELVKRYPDPNAAELIDTLSKKLDLPTSYLIGGSGSDDLLDLIVRTYATECTRILGIFPSFSMYEFYAKINGAQFNAIPLILRLNQETGIARYELDLSNFISNAKESQIIILARPNNPDGMIFTRNFILELLELNKLVIVDEAYIDFSNEPSLIDLIPEYKNLIITRSFSKSFSLAGLRLGYMISSPQIINILTRVKSPYTVNNVAIAFATMLLNNQECIMENIRKIKSIRLEFYKDLRKLQKKYGDFYFHPSEANFVLIRLQSKERARLLFEHFLKFNIKLRKFQGNLANCLRISIGTSFQMKEVIRILDSFIRGK
jgi:histidinol-phosphate aminotransferase